jgi:hypothetical protein
MSGLVPRPVQGTWYGQTKQVVWQLDEIRNRFYGTRDWNGLNRFLTQVSDPAVQTFLTTPDMTASDLFNALLSGR